MIEKLLIVKLNLILCFCTIIPLFVQAQAPGGIASGLDVWNKANADAYRNSGTTLANHGDGVAQWNDQGPLGFNVGQNNASQQPTFNEAGINYNPALFFDGGDYLFRNNYSLSGDMSYFFATSTGGTANNGLLNIASTSSWNSNAVYLTTRTPSSRSRFVYRRSPSSSGGNNLDAGSSVVSGQNQLFSFKREQGSLQELWIDAGDYQSMNATVSNYTGTTLNFSYGMLTSNSRQLTGNFAEAIKYNRALTTAQQRKVETYLSIKYGITMNQNYQATNNTIIYDQSTYANTIIGIGRDDAEALVQKQSHTQDDTLRVYLSTLAATNIANTGSFANDIAYVVLGSDNAQLCSTAASLLEKPATVDLRLEREWKVENTNLSETFSVDVRVASCAGTDFSNVSDLRLLVDDDGDFSDATIFAAGNGLSFSYASDIITITGISNSHIPMNSARFITIGTSTVILPIQLLNFTAQLNSEKTVDVNWVTKEEQNIDKFYVQRSADGVSFEDFHSLIAQGQTGTTNYYALKDPHPFVGNNYYRLKVIENDGDVYYSQVVMLYRNGDSDNYYFSPNPTQGIVYYEYQASSSDQLQIDVLDVLGNKVRTYRFSGATGFNKMPINLEDLPNGSYIVRVFNEQMKTWHTNKIIKH